jgi:alpha-L-fucosidase
MTDSRDVGGDGGWFAAARFGLFIHWGIYSVKGWEPSWPLVGNISAFPAGQDVPVEEYYAAAPAFRPPEGAPREWMRLARACGMQYAVLTARHHDGYTLFPSEHASLGVAEHLPGRDLVAEYVDAARDAGLRVGLYFSLPDWRHEGYPAWRDDMRPYGFNYPRGDEAGWARFLADLRGQLTHLLTAYGTIDSLWFDGGWERTPDEWRSSELGALIFELAPDIVVNDRLPGLAGYATPEQTVAHPPPSGAWETCLTMGESWGPNPSDEKQKTTAELLGILAEVAAGGGNLLHNVSPDGDGALVGWQRARLEAIAAWMSRHAAAILHTHPSGLAPWQFYGPTTANARATFLLCPMQPQGVAVLRRVYGKHITGIRALGTGVELPFELRLSALDRIVGGDPCCDVVISVPPGATDEVMTVIEITTEGTLI